jgi:hypothetical protein
MGKVSTSAFEARELARPRRRRVVFNAFQTLHGWSQALALAESGYPPRRPPRQVAGDVGIATFKMMLATCWRPLHLAATTRSRPASPP